MLWLFFFFFFRLYILLLFYNVFISCSIILVQMLGKKGVRVRETVNTVTEVLGSDRLGFQSHFLALRHQAGTIRVSTLHLYYQDDSGIYSANVK